MNLQDQVLELKEKGNDCVRSTKYEEAIIHYTHAIKLDPTNFSLYSNRSLAFLKIGQYYLAMEDALVTIKLNPSWAKGFFRRAEIEYATYNFSEALVSYGLALKRQPDDANILEAIMRTTKEMQKDKKADAQIPWLGAGVGIILGVVIVIADQILANKPMMVNPVLMAVLTITIAMMGYGSARAFRYYVRCQRVEMLMPPPNLQEDDDKQANGEKVDEALSSEAGKEKERSHQKYTKAQARQRLKKGRT